MQDHGSAEALVRSTRTWGEHAESDCDVDVCGWLRPQLQDRRSGASRHARRESSRTGWERWHLRSEQPGAVLVADDDRLSRGSAPQASSIGTANFGALLKAIKAHKRLQTVYWFGHGASGELQFGNGVRFRAEDIASLKSPDVSEHFEVNGSLVLLACNAGQSDAFLQAIANALRVTVSGYRLGVKWRLDYQDEAPRRKITYRGLSGGIPDIQLTKFPQRTSK